MRRLPAYMRNKIAAEVFDVPRSVIYAQAENRLHMKKGNISIIIKGRKIKKIGGVK